MPRDSFALRVILPTLYILRCATPGLVSYYTGLSIHTVVAVLLALHRAGVAHRPAYGVYCIGEYERLDIIRAALLHCGVEVKLKCRDMAGMLLKNVAHGKAYVNLPCRKNLTSTVRALAPFLGRGMVDIVLPVEEAEKLSSHLCRRVERFEELYRNVIGVKVGRREYINRRRGKEAAQPAQPSPGEDIPEDLLLEGRPASRF